jgi:hypothetical protein
MSLFADFFTRAKLAPTDAEVIFDRDEPVGQPTDIVMPRRRWFRRSKETNDQQRDVISRSSRPRANSK